MGSEVEAAGPVSIEAQIASPVPISTVSLWRDDRWAALVAYSPPTYVRSCSRVKGGT